MKHFFSLVAGIVLLTMSAGSAVGATENSAEHVVRNTTQQVLEVLRKEGDGITSNSTRLYEVIDELILPHFDFRKMSRWVLGRHWRKASPEQQQAFMVQFQGLLVRTYAQSLIDFRNQKIEILPMSAEATEPVMVHSRIHRSGGPSIPVIYKMHIKENVWKVFDVSIDGVSLVINYRASFNQEIKRNGIDGLIKRLMKHNSRTT